MASFVIEGGRTLKGEFIPQGAKNEALQVIAAALLTDEEISLHNLPEINDIKSMLKLIEILGGEVKKIGPANWRIRCKNIYPENLIAPESIDQFRKIRGSILLVGPLLARFGSIKFPSPGGDRIGRRSIDTHLESFQSMGYIVKYDKDKGIYEIMRGGHRSNYILLDEPSVTGTANVLMVASLQPGKTTIYNAACEPYIQQLCSLLKRMGVGINGAGTNLIEVNGKEALGGASHTILPDMIEVGSIIGLAAMVGSEITIKNAGTSHLGNIIKGFKKLGINCVIVGDDIYIPHHPEYHIQERIGGGIISIYDAPWPGFPADLISIVITVATQGIGSILVHQKMFESRLFFVDRLIEMGAKIILCDPHRVVVIGMGKKTPLRGISMSSPDIRAGMSLLIAALSAQGTSVIHNIEQIQRGYENIHERLNKLGASIHLQE